MNYASQYALYHVDSQSNKTYTEICFYYHIVHIFFQFAGVDKI